MNKQTYHFIMRSFSHFHFMTALTLFFLNDFVAALVIYAVSKLDAWNAINWWSYICFGNNCCLLLCQMYRVRINMKMLYSITSKIHKISFHNEIVLFMTRLAMFFMILSQHDNYLHRIN